MIVWYGTKTYSTGTVVRHVATTREEKEAMHLAGYRVVEIDLERAAKEQAKEAGK